MRTSTQIAQELKDIKPHPQSRHYTARYEQWAACVIGLANVQRTINPLFDKVAFHAECAYRVEEA